MEFISWIIFWCDGRMTTERLFETRLDILLWWFYPRESVFSPTNYLEYFGVYLSFPKSWHVQEYLPKLKSILPKHILYLWPIILVSRTGWWFLNIYRSQSIIIIIIIIIIIMIIIIIIITRDSTLTESLVALKLKL